jgi:two-component system sensor histidine kinase YesM
MVAEVNADSEVSEMLYSLGNILKYSISLKQEIVTVQEEIAHLQDYIMLQRIRFEDIFIIELHVDSKINDTPILKLLLQPILENAIYHGMAGVARGGIITIKGFAQDSSLVFEIADNGAGIPQGRLEALNGYINGMNEELNSIGLKNVQRRIELYYGHGYGVEVSSDYGTGFVVRVRLPADMNERRNT